MKENVILYCFLFQLHVIQQKKIFIMSSCTKSAQEKPIIVNEGLHN